MQTSELALEMADYRPDPGEITGVLRAARAGDSVAFGDLIRMHERLVLRTALRLLGNLADAQDAAQDVFLRLYQHLGRFDEVRQFKPWLYRVTVNVCRDAQRKQTRMMVSLDHLRATTGFEQAEDAPDPEAALGASERRRLLREGLAMLSNREREAFVLRDLEGVSTRDVARALGTREVTVRSQIAMARVKLKKFAGRRTRRRP